MCMRSVYVDGGMTLFHVGCCSYVELKRISPRELGQCSHLHMGSLSANRIGDEGARDLGAALKINTTLTTL